jgi:hypothetical protein
MSQRLHEWIRALSRQFYIVIEPNKKAIRIAVPFNDFPSASIGCRIFIKDKVA